MGHFDDMTAQQRMEAIELEDRMSRAAEDQRKALFEQRFDASIAMQALPAQVDQFAAPAPSVKAKIEQSVAPYSGAAISMMPLGSKRSQAEGRIGLLHFFDPWNGDEVIRPPDSTSHLFSIAEGWTETRLDRVRFCLTGGKPIYYDDGPPPEIDLNALPDTVFFRRFKERIQAARDAAPPPPPEPEAAPGAWGRVKAAISND